MTAELIQKAAASTGCPGREAVARGSLGGVVCIYTCVYMYIHIDIWKFIYKYIWLSAKLCGEKLDIGFVTQVTGLACPSCSKQPGVVDTNSCDRIQLSANWCVTCSLPQTPNLAQLLRSNMSRRDETQTRRTSVEHNCDKDVGLN